MSETRERLIESILQLDPADRLIIATAIVDSLDSPSTEGCTADVQMTWASQISGRINEVQSRREEADGQA